MSLDREYFDAMYSANPDPWSLNRRWYDRRKYMLTIAALPRPRYERGLEIGCSVGVLTAMLADRCDALLAIDTSQAAIAEAARRNLPKNVTLRQMSVPDQWPDGTFDLLVMSEVGYYFDAGALDRVITKTGETLRDGGHLVAVHWRPQVEAYPSNARAVHDRLRSESKLVALASYADEHFLLDVFGTGTQSKLCPPD